MEIEIIENVMQYNKEEADINRKIFLDNQITVINILSSPGAGKTSLIMETIKNLAGKVNFAVIEGDVSSTHDSEKIKKLIENVVQINTGGTCHLNASMIAQAIKKINLQKTDILFIENVGNLICPVGFDLGEDYKIVLSSVTEGDDKPVKYPKVFIKSNLVLLNKTDMMQHNDFDYDFFKNEIKKINAAVEIISLSCKTGENFKSWIEWLENSISLKKLKGR